MYNVIKTPCIKPDKAFMLYFSLMFCLYTNTYIQLLSQLGIIAYVLFCHYPIFRIKKETINVLLFYLSWFGMLTALMLASKYLWAYSSYEDSKTMLTLIRIFVIGCVLFLYVDSYEKAISVMEAFIVSAAVMGFAALVTTPLSQYGLSDTEGSFGDFIGQHRNQIGAISAPLVFLCYYMEIYFNFSYGKKLSVFFLILTLCTGSRGSIFQVFIIFIFISLTGKSLTKKLQSIIVLSIGIALTLVIIYYVPFLYEVIWVRVENMLLTQFGTTIADTSTLGRSLYKQIAWIMFRQRPLLGFGLDGFYCYLKDNSRITGYFLNPVYSHCNYAELAANLGIAGLLIWYVPIFNVLIGIFKKRKKSRWCACLLCVFISMVVMDYARIPWETHLVMYFFFCIILLCRYGNLKNWNLLLSYCGGIL